MCPDATWRGPCVAAIVVLLALAGTAAAQALPQALQSRLATMSPGQRAELQRRQALLLGMWKGKGDLVPWLVAALAAIISARLIPGSTLCRGGVTSRIPPSTTTMLAVVVSVTKPCSSRIKARLPGKRDRACRSARK